MTRNFSQQLNIIAKKAGMLDFIKRPFIFSAYRLVVNSLSKIDSYFEKNRFPIRLILGDPNTIKQLVQLCPTISDIPAFPIEEIQNIDIAEYNNGTILIAQESFFDTLRFETEIYNMSPSCRVCSLYEYLEWNHINIRIPFWSIKQFSLFEKCKMVFHYLLSYEWINSIVNPIYYKRQSYTHLSIWRYTFINRNMIFCTYHAFASGFLSVEEKKIQYKKLMGYCVLEKDIIGLKKYIKEYSDCYDKDFKKYIDKIDRLLLLMKNRIAARHSKDIILNWVDSISNKRMASDMPFLYKMSQSQNCIKSEYAYTSMPWTTVTMKSIIMGKNPIEGKLYRFDTLPKDAALFQVLRKHGYHFRYYGDVYGQMKLFSRKHRGMSLNNMNTYISTEYLWKALDYLACTKDMPAFLLIHELRETHVPYYCPESNYLRTNDYTDFTDEEKKLSALWMDRQYEFYTEIMGQKSMQIFMGDHGDHEKYKYDYFEGKVHVAFFIRNPIQKIDFSKGMFSLKNFVLLLNVIMGWDNITSSNPLTEYVIAESYDYYGSGKINEIISNKGPEKLYDKKAWMQHKTIRNKQYVYILFFDGEELLYNLQDENVNLIDYPEYKEILEDFRRKLGTEFIDIYQEKFFTRTRKLYKAYQNLRHTENCQPDEKAEGDIK